MISITIDDELKRACPNIQLACILADVSIQPENELLWKLIDQTCDSIATELQTDKIRHIAPIAAAREAYKACGKDPARYRLSAEALLRRVVSGKGLYTINNVVDLLNLVSIKTGFSIGGYDADQLSLPIQMGIGKANEPYEGLGRGELNIEGMPVFRDQQGAFGTSTSDSVRTGVTDQTVRFLMVIVAYQADQSLDEASRLAVGLLTNFAEAQNIKTSRIDF